LSPTKERTVPELRTKEQALAYLEEMSPTETYHVEPFQHGWVCTKELTPEQMNTGAAVGLARLVIDSETGIVYQYPSWSETMVAEAHTTFKETGVPQGTQIYPPKWTISIQLTQEDTQKVVYQLTAQSLIQPPEPTRRHLLTIENLTQNYGPTDRLSTIAMAHATWLRDQNGKWPETDTTHA
jgi:hypothetical protein